MAATNTYTPMVQQYMAVKEQHKNELLFFRLGDFYEMFFEDALTASRELNITLTKRAGSGDNIPMCGVPYHSVDGYIAKLVQKGYRIAICEQMEDPRFAKGIVERKVIKIITPGTALNEQLLQDKHNRYLVLLVEELDEVCMAVADVSTGECQWFLTKGNDRLLELEEQLYRLQPAELVLTHSLAEQEQLLEWLGAKLPECTLTNYVEEKAGEEENRVGSVVAARDGVIVSCTVLEGTAKCTPGQAVRLGQVLISGYTDCGICIRAAWAKGEVYARTRREITVITPAEWDERDAQTGSATRFSLIFGKKRINLWKGSGIWDSSCGRIETEYPLVLPGGFRLPVALAVEKLIFWNTEPTASIEAAAEAELKAFADDYLTSQMVAGKILYAVESVFPQAGGYVLTGQYDCLEMIGRERAEEMGENHGQSD